MTRVQSIARKVLENLKNCPSRGRVVADKYRKGDIRFGTMVDVCTIRELWSLAQSADGRPIEVKAKRKRK